ncbi:MAG: putative transrane anti-sigma factor [Variovorax sp.]|nr:putative transrane anti-sigma factor [Variovorax sp.]
MNAPIYSATDDELHAFVDGRLTPERHAAISDLLRREPALAARVTAWQVQRDALRQLHLGLLDEPVPAPLLKALHAPPARAAERSGWLRWGGMAACFVVAFAAGWLVNAQWTVSRSASLAKAPVAAPAAAIALVSREFVHAASVAHAVYAPEKRHPVEVAAAEQQHLVQWLSKRLDRPLKVPDLSSEGYSLVGGRLLPGDEGARAQFMFENAAGERVTLYIGALEAATSGGTPSRETAFRFTSDGPVPSFYWIDHGFGYAVAGKLPRETLMKLATVTYRQLS